MGVSGLWPILTSLATLTAWATFVASLLVICALSLHLVVIFLTYKIFRSRGEVMEAKLAALRLPAELPHVLIQLPTFNEPDVVERALEAAAAIEWPIDRLHIQLLDDSTDETTAIAHAKAGELRAKGFDVEIVHRENREGFKAGALKAGLEQAKWPYVAIFDVDFIPPPDILKKAMPTLLHDERIAFVQTRWEHLNADASLLTRAQALMLNSHFAIEQAVRSWTGLPMPFNGTGGIWRRAAIDDAGGWEADTLTEDLDLSLRANLRGWRTAFLRNVAVPSELPETVAAWRNQQFRWTKGFAQVAIKLLPRVWRAQIPVTHKFAVTFQLFQGWAYPAGCLALVSALAAMLLTVTQPWPIIVFGLTSTGVGGLGVICMVMGAQAALKRPLTQMQVAGFFAMLALNGGLTIANTRAIYEAIIGRASAFVRTPKGKTAQLDKARPTKGHSGVAEVAFAGLAATIAIWDHAWLSPFFTLTVVGLALVGGASMAAARSR